MIWDNHCDIPEGVYPIIMSMQLFCRHCSHSLQPTQIKSRNQQTHKGIKM